MVTGLFVGRFQPFHRGHLATVKYALGKVDRLVIMVGSSQKSHEVRNPFTAGERIMMIKEALDADKEVDVRQTLIIPVPDAEVHSLWTHQVDMYVPKYQIVFANDPLTGLLFKERNIRVEEAPLLQRTDLSGTEVRERMVLGKDWEGLVAPAVADVIREIDGTGRLRVIFERQSTSHHGK